MADGQTFHFIPYIGIHVWQTDRQHFISSLLVESMYDRRTNNIHFISHFWIHVWQTDKHFISSVILESMYDRRKDNISFQSSYWNPRMTDGQTFHFIPHIGIHVWQTDRHFISSLILESTHDRHFISFLILESMYDRRTDISFHPSYWDLLHTDGQIFHFISYLILVSTYDRRTDISFNPLYWNPRMTDGQTFHFILSLILDSTYDRRTDISFHSLYWNECMTDGQTTFHFFRYIGIHVWQTDRHFISSVILESMYDGKTTFHFIPHIGIHVWQTDRHFISFLILESMYDRRTDNISFHTLYWNPCMTDGQTTFHFISHIWIHVWQTDRHFISSLILESTYDRRTDNISFHPLNWNPRMTDGQTFHLILHIGIHVWQTDRQHFMSSLILESTYDRRTDISFHTSYLDLLHTDGQPFHFIPHIGIHVWQTDRQHLILFLILESMYDRRTDISFHFIPDIRFHVWQTDRQHFISFLKLGSTSHRPTDNISFHSSYWIPCMTDGQTTFHFIPYIGFHVWQTDRHFISFYPSYWIPRMTDGQTFHFIPYIGIHVWQTDRHFIFIPHIGIYFTQTDKQHFIWSLILESTHDRPTDISFHPLYWNPRMTDGQTFHFILSLILYSTYDRLTDISFHTSYSDLLHTDGQTFHFIPHIWIHVWQTDRHFISCLIFGSTSHRRTDISFHSSYWFPCMTDGQTFHFIPHIRIYFTQTDRQHFISYLILESMYDRRKDNISFHSSYRNPRMTDGQTFHFIPHIGIHVWQTDRQHFISYLILESMYDRRTDNILFHFSYLNPCMKNGQTFHFIPYIGIHVWQTDRHFISSLILKSRYDRRTDISYHPLYWNPRITDGQTFHFIPYIGIHVLQTDRHFISSLILESTYYRRTDISYHPLNWNPRITDG